MEVGDLYNGWEYDMGKLNKLGCFQVLDRHPNLPGFFFRLKNVKIIEGIRVTNNFEKYWFKMLVDKEKGPKLYVWSPIIKRLHHVWGDDHLCLYDPREFYWTQSPDIIKKVIGWTYLWIVYFEEWQKTGKWPGPEIVHTKTKSDEK